MFLSHGRGPPGCNRDASESDIQIYFAVSIWNILIASSVFFVHLDHFNFHVVRYLRSDRRNLNLFKFKLARREARGPARGTRRRRRRWPERLILFLYLFVIFVEQLKTAHAMQACPNFDGRTLGDDLYINTDSPSEMGELLGGAIIAATGGDVNAINQVLGVLTKTVDDAIDNPAKRRRRDESYPEQATPDTGCAMLLMRNIRTFVSTTLSTLGTRPHALQQKALALAEALFSHDIISRRLASAMERLTGISKSLFMTGGRLREENASRSREIQLTVPERARRSDAVSLDWVWEWFHAKSPDVEPDKSTKWKYSRKRVKVAGKV